MENDDQMSLLIVSTLLQLLLTHEPEGIYKMDAAACKRLAAVLT